MTSSSSGAVLHMFRRMLKQIQKLPNNERKNTLIQIKSEFHKNKNISDDKDIEKLLNKAESSLGYLKMITPKSKGQSSEPYHRVFGKGSDVPIKKAVTNWTGKNMDPDSVARHNATLKRAGFRDNAHAKGIF